MSLDLIRKNIRIVVIGGQPLSLSNDMAVSLCKDKAGSFGYRHDCATMQQEAISKLINAANDDPNSSDQVGKFLGGVLDSVKKAFGAEIGNRKVSWFGGRHSRRKLQLLGLCLSYKKNPNNIL